MTNMAAPNRAALMIKPMLCQIFFSYRICPQPKPPEIPAVSDYCFQNIYDSMIRQYFKIK